MDHQLPKQLPKPSILILALVLGAFFGIGLYRLSAERNLPLLKIPKVEAPVQTQQRTQTILNEENAIIGVVEKTSDSVVAIGATRKVFNPFDPFSIPRDQNSTIGTGFIVSEKGIVVTNKHVVSDFNTTYTVITKDSKKFEVRKIYRDPVLDLAIVQIDEGGLKPLELGDSSKLKVGQTVVAIGNALGRFTNTVTTGVVSGLGRRVVAGDPFSGSAESLDDLIQTDAAINPGNSGGPLLNSAGQVIGVNVATTEGAQNIGFAIPINSVKKIVDEFIAKGVVSRPYLGIKYRFISKDIAVLNELPQGAYVQDVLAGSSAEKAGIMAGDIITKIDGKTVNDESIIANIIAGKNVGDKIILNIWRDGVEKSITATLQELPNQ